MGPEPALPRRGTGHQVVVELLLHGPLTRGELGLALGLTPGSVTRAVRPLLDAGLVHELDVVLGPGLGRPVTPLDLVLDRDVVVGVKITAGRVWGVVAGLRAEVLHEASTELSSTDPAVVVDAVADIVRRLLSRCSDRAVHGVGVSVGGQVDDVGHVSVAPLLDWVDVDLGAALRQRLDLPVVVDNDVVSLVRAERWLGAARDLDRFALVTVGAGLGYALVVGGAILELPSSARSPIAHVPLGIGDGVCDEGHRGCASSVLALSAVLGRAARALGREGASLDELLAAHASGHPGATAVVEEAAEALGALLALVADLAWPRAIVVTGDGIGVGLAGRDVVDSAMRARRAADAEPVTVDLQATGFTRWARGAAVAAVEAFVVDR
ncbi:ROK family transcriptional regulator [Frigoribacterium sp. PvP032]|uniref:ROK family transcriptional regulator n=1 Tax=Frigoribacterium sp. PvP032 TaxID=2806589 RepID=UPI001AE61288|nr:ROK family transcriptional regulator [Frigoribacterium sp. PvP032]MBP1189733.1 putative NBD/HSP70 family sugar kinase [Frigoribacterium sp. PvP032]